MEKITSFKYGMKGTFSFYDNEITITDTYKGAEIGMSNGLYFTGYYIDKVTGKEVKMESKAGKPININTLKIMLQITDKKDYDTSGNGNGGTSISKKVLTDDEIKLTAEKRYNIVLAKVAKLEKLTAELKTLSETWGDTMETITANLQQQNEENKKIVRQAKVKKQIQNVLSDSLPTLADLVELSKNGQITAEEFQKRTMELMQKDN